MDTSHNLSQHPVLRLQSPVINPLRVFYLQCNGNAHVTVAMQGCGRPRCQGGKNIALGGGMARKPICPTPPPPLVAVPGVRRGGFGAGAALPAVPGGGGGGSTPTSVAQNDPHVALIILTTHMWGGGGGGFFGGRSFLVQHLCSGAFGGNIGPYTKQRAWHGSPFLEPPSFSGRLCPPPPPPAEQCSSRPMRARPWERRRPEDRVREKGVQRARGGPAGPVPHAQPSVPLPYWEWRGATWLHYPCRIRASKAEKRRVAVKGVLVGDGHTASGGWGGFWV